MTHSFQLSADTLRALLRDARSRSLQLVSGLAPTEWMGPYLDIVNPPQWELGHMSFFYEAMVLRQLGLERDVVDKGNELYDSFEVDHVDRWTIPLLTPEQVLDYHRRIEEMLLQRLERGTPGPRETYLYLLGVFHEDMHGEALVYTRQTHGYPAPPIGRGPAAPAAGPLPGDVDVPGGTLELGATRDAPFVFDNETWSHPVDVAPFRMARAPVTNVEFAAFVEDGGYRREALWDFRGWRWRVKLGLEQPLYWRREGGAWLRRHFDEWRPLEPHHPVIFVSWFEARAFCRWAGRRLPTEAEWELAAGGLEKRKAPWGDAPPGAEHANLDGHQLGCVDVAAYPEGDSPFGCRQMWGNVWEWTETPFYPYPGFRIDHPYREYSAPWFGYPKVLRGGCWVTRGRLLRNTFRNFYDPRRRDVLAGFRTCAVH